MGRSQDNRIHSPTAIQLTERKKNGDDRDIFTISGFQRSSTQILITKRRPVLHRQSLSSTTDVRSPTHAAVLDQLVDGGDARACYCTLTAAETHPRVLPTTCSGKKRVVALRCHHQRARAASSGCCPSGGDEQLGCRRAGRCRISGTCYDATPRAIVSIIESSMNGLIVKTCGLKRPRVNLTNIGYPKECVDRESEWGILFFIELRGAAKSLSRSEQSYRYRVFRF